MSRPREFDESAALDAAVRCFCARGYEQVSVRELADDMGITCASLYNAFGDKRTLYSRALAHYRVHSVRARITRLEAALAPREAILAYLDDIVAGLRAMDRDRGCMLVHCALELAPHDAEFRRLVRDEMRRIEAFFRRMIEAARIEGTIPRTRSAIDLARLLLALVLGLRVLAQTRPGARVLESALKPARALLGGG